MHNIDLNGDELSTLIATLEIEEWRINNYYGAIMQYQGAEMTTYDKGRLESINALINKLKQKQGGRNV